MRFVFWQNMASPHQSAVLRALAADPDTRVELLVGTALPPERERLGWSVPDFGRVELRVAPSPGEVRKRVRTAPEESVHVFSGIGAYPLVEAAFREAARTPALLGVMSEAADWQGWRGRLRVARARVEALRFRRRVGLVLAIGELGQRWFRRVGYPAERIYPFGYVVEREEPAGAASGPSEGDAGVQLVFIGECVRRKGGDLLLRALAPLSHLPWRLTVVGDGAERAAWERLAADLGISSRVRMPGALPNREAMEVLGRSDLLVLPSRWDGWGAVVNEALVRGVPALCSSHCGAADLVAGSERGEVFAAESERDLRAVLERAILRGGRTAEAARRIARWSERISGPVVAAYLREVVAAARGERPRPRVPWRDPDGVSDPLDRPAAT